jgi:hypothetical protein
MLVNRTPARGNGFIYILSNPSMPNVYKIGLTSNSVKTRIRELSSTGVPTPFIAEKLFEIPLSDLRSVEKLAHENLKNKNLHHGKEFFNATLADCENAVLQAINDFSIGECRDILAEAGGWSEEEKINFAKIIEEKKALEKARRERAERIRLFNAAADAMREDFVQKEILIEKQRESFIKKYIFNRDAALFFFVTFLPVFLDRWPLGLFGALLYLSWALKKSKGPDSGFIYQLRQKAKGGFKYEVQ